MDKEFSSKLDELLKLVNRTFTNINSGGCGHFAMILGEALKEVGIESTAVCLQTYIDKECVDEIKHLYKTSTDDLNELNAKGGFISHMVLKVDDIYLDSTGIIGDLSSLNERYSGYHVVGEIMLEKLSKWVETGKWNDMFDVKQLPRIKYVIDKYLNKELDIMSKVKFMIDVLDD